MKHFIVTCEFWSEIDGVMEEVELNSYGFTSRHAVKAIKHDNPSLVRILSVSEQDW